MDCPFCDNREVERQVCGDDLVFCLVNFEPIKDGHVMIIPRRHVTRLAELTPAEAQAMNVLTDRMVDVVGSLYGENPAIRVNHGSHKTVGHLHVHVLPSKGDLRDHYVAHEGLPRRVRRAPEEIAAMAERLRAAFR